MTSVMRVRNLPAFGALAPVAVLSALVGVLLCTVVPPAAAGSAFVSASDVASYRGIHWRIVPDPACPDSVIRIRFDACRCNVQLIGVTQPPNGPITLRARVDPNVVCVQCDPDSVDFPLGQLAVGNFTVAIEIVADVVDTLGGVHSETADFFLPFVVVPSCVKLPGKILPYLDDVRIGQISPCPECPPVACADREIPVVLSGAFPDNCISLEQVVTVPSPIVGPRAEPEMIQVIYAINSCIDRPCAQVITPWEAVVNLSALAPGPYGLIVQTLVHDQCSKSLPIPIGQTVLPFTVEGCDSIPIFNCFDARFVQRPADGCDDFIAPGKPAHATFEVASTTYLAGMQGRFRFDRPGLAIENLDLIGPAAGMRLLWNREPDGARFVLFSDNGTLLPPHLPNWDEPWVPILSVTASTDAVLSDRARLAASELIASDSVGDAVPECAFPLRAGVYRDHDATFCPEHACDWNGDGLADVRDLVRMVLCIWGGVCPDTSGSAMDCDANGLVNLDDVLCCARHVLRGDAPDGGGGRAEPGVAVTLDAPQRVEGGWDVPLTLYGAKLLGAARLDLSYPRDRYDVAGVDMHTGSGWLGLAEPGDGRVGLGWILAGPPEASTDRQTALVHLRRKPGAADGGDLTLSSSQFAAPDGAALKVQTAGLSLPLAGGRIALSSPLPNPFGGETRFSVMLSQAGDLDVGVFDAGGRRIATLFRGQAPAGVRGFGWDGRRDSGQSAGSGLYFVRAETAGEKVSRKVMILGPR